LRESSAPRREADVHDWRHWSADRRTRIWLPASGERRTRSVGRRASVYACCDLAHRQPRPLTHSLAGITTQTSVSQSRQTNTVGVQRGQPCPGRQRCSSWHRCIPQPDHRICHVCHLTRAEKQNENLSYLAAATGQVRSTWTINEIIRYRVTWFEWTLEDSHKLKTLVVEVNFDTDPNTTDLRHWTKFETSSAVLWRTKRRWPWATSALLQRKPL